MKKSFLKYCVFVFLLLGYVIAHSQQKSEKVKMGDFSAVEGNFYEAIELYTEELQKNKNNAYAMQQLAFAYQKIGEYKTALSWFEQLFLLQNKEFPLAELYYAQSLKSMEQYAKAAEHFEHFRKNYKGVNQSYYTGKAKDEMKDCEIAQIALPNENAVINVLPSSINKRYSELSPLLYHDSMLIFSGIISDTLIKVDIEESNPKVRLYAVNLKDSAAQPQLFLPHIFQSFEGNIPDIIFSADGQRLFFTECKKNTEGKMTCQLYAATKNDYQWQLPIKLGDLVNEPSGQFTSLHPALGWDPKSKQDILYFVSDRNGGNGGLDLWYAEIDRQFNIEKSYNMGRRFNTADNEITPFIEPTSGDLYFSSNGFQSFGGYDILVARDKGKKIDKPQNIGKPFNSSLDDFYFRKIDKESGYLVSNRSILQKQNCCDDIFYFHKEQKKYFSISIKEKLSDSTEREINEVQVKTSWIKDSTTINEVGKIYEINPSDTAYINVFLEQIKINQEYRLNNIYFDYDKATLTPESTQELEQLQNFLNENPNLVIEIAAYTDNKGSAEYNLKLSQHRAKSVVNYLIAKGIAPERLVAKGYGMTQPIAFNTFPDGSDNPEGRQQNRRIIFKVVGEIKTPTNAK